MGKTATCFLAEGRVTYGHLGLDVRIIVATGAQFEVFTWLADAANEPIACFPNRKGIQASIAGSGIEIIRESYGEEDVRNMLRDSAEGATPTLDVLLADAMNLEREK